MLKYYLKVIEYNLSRDKGKNMAKVGDFYWAHADILRGIGINESTYDQRIMAFMALKLLIDNKKVKFTFDYTHKGQFGLDDKTYAKYKGSNTKETFSNLIANIKDLGQNLQYFIQDSKYNPGDEENILCYIDHKKTFILTHYIEELANEYLEMLLDIYVSKADFTDYPKEQYKDLYEVTIARMKKLSGDLTGQHFTQKSIIHLMCESVISDLKNTNSDKLAIYDPACGTGSMLMESAYYFKHHIKGKSIEVFGQEFHGQTWFLCKLFLEISGINNIVAYGNTLTNPAFDKINGDDSFDFIIANPPFGVDWKHDYEAVIKNMKIGDASNYYIVKDEKGNPVTPKKSDGQFLFILHILKLLAVSKEKNKHAKAAIISSTGLITSGKENSAEGKIRKDIFGSGWVDTLIEQPKAMFTNTDISTLIWILDNQNTESRGNSTFLLKMDNSYINAHFKAKEIKVLFSDAQMKQDKQKNGYGVDNIATISSIINHKIEFSLFSKYKKFDNQYTINYESEFSYADDYSSNTSIDKFSLEASYKVLSLALMFSPQLENKIENFKSTIDHLASYIDGSYTDGFYNDYISIYKDVCSMIQKKRKLIDKTFKKLIADHKAKEIHEMQHIFEEVCKLNKSTQLTLEIA